jgi:hypothetical protein
MAYKFAVFRRCRCGEVCDTSINPPDRIGHIGTIDRDLIADEEILCHIGFHPFTKTLFLFDRPSSIPNGPDLPMGFLRGFAEGWKGEKKAIKNDKENHALY